MGEVIGSYECQSCGRRVRSGYHCPGCNPSPGAGDINNVSREVEDAMEDELLKDAKFVDGRGAGWTKDYPTEIGWYWARFWHKHGGWCVRAALKAYEKPEELNEVVEIMDGGTVFKRDQKVRGRPVLWRRMTEQPPIWDCEEVPEW